MMRLSRIVTSLMVLMALCAPSRAVAQDTVIYYHTDAVGSVRATSDANGVLTHYDYTPFGQPWPGTAAAETRRFAGKELDSGTDFDYFGARYYASTNGRFTTVDPHSIVLEAENAEELVAFLANPQRWNRYAYGLNNPLSFSDPDGRLPIPLIYTAAAYLAVSPAGQRAIIAGSNLLSRYGTQLQSFAWTVGGRISGDIFTRVGPLLTGRLAETLRGAPEAFRFTKGIDNFVNGTAIGIKTLDIFAKTYQNLGRLGSQLSGYVDQLASYSGGQTPLGFVQQGQIQRRVLEIVLPGGTLSPGQLQVLGRVQQEALRRGVEVVYIQTP